MFFSQQQQETAGNTTNNIKDTASSTVPSLDWSYVREVLSSISDIGDSEFSSLFDGGNFKITKIEILIFKSNYCDG